jgi:hypothetical protein
MQNLKQILALLSAECHRFEALLDERKIPKRNGSIRPISLAKASIFLRDLPLNCNPSNMICFSKRIDFKSNASEYP